MNVAELIAELQELPPELEVYTCHGASGCYDRVGTPSQYTVTGNEDTGDLIDMKPGTKLTVIYIGN